MATGTRGVSLGSREEVTQLLDAVRGGSSRRRAQTLNTTALVHETYLKLVDRSRISPADRRHFLATAARAMRQIIVDYARRSRARECVGELVRVPIGEAETPLDPGDVRVEERAAEILAVDEALWRLDELSPRLSRVVELRFFGGFSIEEVSELMGTSLRNTPRPAG